MAYPYCCNACLDGEHDECEEKQGIPDTYGVGFCVCYGAKHKPEGNKFAMSVIKTYSNFK